MHLILIGWKRNKWEHIITKRPMNWWRWIIQDISTSDIDEVSHLDNDTRWFSVKNRLSPSNFLKTESSIPLTPCLFSEYVVADLFRHFRLTSLCFVAWSIDECTDRSSLFELYKQLVEILYIYIYLDCSIFPYIRYLLSLHFPLRLLYIG